VSDGNSVSVREPQRLDYDVDPLEAVEHVELVSANSVQPVDPDL